MDMSAIWQLMNIFLWIIIIKLIIYIINKRKVEDKKNKSKFKEYDERLKHIEDKINK